MTDAKSEFVAYIDLVKSRTRMSPTQIARKAKMSPSTINRPYNQPESIKHKPSLGTIGKIVNATGIPYKGAVTNVFPDNDNEAKEVATESPQSLSSNSPDAITKLREPHVEVPSLDLLIEDLEVLGTAEGGSGGEMILGEKIDTKRRPPALKNVSDAYAIYVVGTSMEPRHREGSLIFVHPHRPPRPGDDVVIQFQNDDGDVTHAMLKELVRRSASKVKVKQYNPEKTFYVPQRDIKAIHLVLTMEAAFGY